MVQIAAEVYIIAAQRWRQGVRPGPKTPRGPSILPPKPVYYLPFAIAMDAGSTITGARLVAGTLYITATMGEASRSTRTFQIFRLEGNLPEGVTCVCTVTCDTITQPAYPYARLCEITSEASRALSVREGAHARVPSLLALIRDTRNTLLEQQPTPEWNALLFRLNEALADAGWELRHEWRLDLASPHGADRYCLECDAFICGTAPQADQEEMELRPCRPLVPPMLPEYLVLP
jgi:hypothetical protein